VKLSQLYEVYPAPPRATMPLGVRVSDVLYASVTGADPVTGAISADANVQLSQALRLLADAVRRAGGSAASVRKLHVCLAHEEDAAWVMRALLELAPMATVSAGVAALPRGQLLRLDALAALDQGDELDAELIFLGATPTAARIGDVLFSAGISAADIETGALVGDTQTQMVAAFDNLDRLLTAAGTDPRSILRIGGYLPDLSEKDVLNDEMVRRFPDASQKPVHKYVPVALPPGVAVSLQFIARLGVEREIIEIEGIKHNDPISLGAKAGNLVVSSRVQGRLMPDAALQAERLIESHARTVLRHVGGDLQHVTQTTWGIGEPSYAEDIAGVMKRHWPGGMPDVRVMQADFPHSGLPRLEFIALLDE
jgi:enamine deaminase RidA (YjgF/YER057c/UK114 family)